MADDVRIDDLVYLEAFELELIPDSFEHALVREGANADVPDCMALYLEPLKDLAKFGNDLLRGLVRPILYKGKNIGLHLAAVCLPKMISYMGNYLVRFLTHLALTTEFQVRNLSNIGTVFTN